MWKAAVIINFISLTNNFFSRRPPFFNHIPYLINNLNYDDPRFSLLLNKRKFILRGGRLSPSLISCFLSVSVHLFPRQYFIPKLSLFISLRPFPSCPHFLVYSLLICLPPSSTITCLPSWPLATHLSPSLHTPFLYAYLFFLFFSRFFCIPSFFASVFFFLSSPFDLYLVSGLLSLSSPFLRRKERFFGKVHERKFCWNAILTFEDVIKNLFWCSS